MRKVARTLVWGIIDILARLHLVSPLGIAKLKYFEMLHRWPDFDNPKDLNEKINWLKFNSDISSWASLSDKYAVREFVAKAGFQDILVPLLGKWDDAYGIRWEDLPERFVIKPNNGSGDVLLCKDKSALDIGHATHYLSKLLKKEYGYLSAEPHYSRIKPCLIAEELLNASTQPNSSNSLVDYKIWCFNGKPSYIMCCSNRTPESLELSLYDLDWNNHPEFIRETSHYRKPHVPIPRPDSFDRMMTIASKLSAGFPESRVDLYEVEGKVFFGEMTFTSAGGFMNYYTPEFLRILGEMVELDHH